LNPPEFTLCHIKGVPIAAHSSLVIALPVGCFLAESLMVGVVGFFAFVALLFLHEWGHAVAAMRQGLRVFRIGLYPFHGICEYELAHSPWSQVLVSWGGVLVQTVLFVVCVLFTKSTLLLGGSIPNELGAAFFVWIPLNALIVMLNLLPIPPLDGATAWKIVPMALARPRIDQPKPKRPSKPTGQAEVGSLDERCAGKRRSDAGE